MKSLIQALAFVLLMALAFTVAAQEKEVPESCLGKETSETYRGNTWVDSRGHLHFDMEDGRGAGTFSYGKSQILVEWPHHDNPPEVTILGVVKKREQGKNSRLTTYTYQPISPDCVEIREAIFKIVQDRHSKQKVVWK